MAAFLSGSQPERSAGGVFETIRLAAGIADKVILASRGSTQESMGGEEIRIENFRTLEMHRKVKLCSKDANKD